MPSSWISRCLLPFLLLSHATCTPVRHRQPYQIRQVEASLVTGATSRDTNGNPFPRREVRDLEEHYPDQWNLYMLALESLQWTSQNDAKSFYGLASIHGRPYQVWGDAPGIDYKIGTTGYCPHGNELFMPWHRPYLALFEQVVSGWVHSIAARAPPDQLERYLAAANEFRMPYWDWAQGTTTGPVPDFFMTPTLTVTDIDQSQVLIYNPLYSYRFKPIPEQFDEKWRQINETIRWPDNDDPWGKSQQWKFADAFQAQSGNLVAQMGVVFRSSTFSHFSTTLEDPHGWMHGIIGGGFDGNVSPYRGHMWPLEYSAFEPLFMLHHTNVDRLLSLWQAAHPDSWMEPSTIGPHGNVYLENNQVVDASTKLLPFRKTPGEFWTFNDCRDTTVLGYTYPETQRWKFDSDEAYQANVTSIISNLYGGRSRKQLMTHHTMAGSQMLLSHNNTFTDWTIESSVVAAKFPSTFVVSFSLVSLFQSDPSVDIGSWMVLMPEHKNEVHTSRRPVVKEKRLNGTTSITSHLIDRVNAGVLASLDQADVVPYLRQYLTWNVYADGGSRIPQSKLDSLIVEVFSTKAHIPFDEDSPIEYSDEVTAHPEITTMTGGGISFMDP